MTYHYAWRGGPRFWSSEDGVPEEGPGYWAAYQRASASADISLGKFRKVIRAFLDSREFAALGERTKADYRRSIDHPKDGIDAEFGDAPIGAFNDPRIRQHVFRWRDGFASPRVADHRKTHLVRIVAWAVDRGMIRQNHLEGMSNLYSADRSEIVWTPDEVERVIQNAPPHLSRAMILATETGLRPGDQIRVRRAHVRKVAPGERRIVLKTAKRARVVNIPVTARLAALLLDTPRRQDHLLLGARGRPWAKASSLSHAMTDLKRELGLRDELHYYDARGYCVTRLVRAGLPLDELALHMGWSPSYAARMLDTYAALMGVTQAELVQGFAPKV